jgi:hypothetical protein
MAYMLEPVPANVENAVAMSVLVKAPIELILGENRLTFENAFPFLLVHSLPAPEVGAYLAPGCDPTDVSRLALFVIRMLPEFEVHPLVALMPGESYQLPFDLLPKWYREKFQHDRTQLDSTVRFTHHVGEGCAFQFPPDRETFQLSWSRIQHAISGGRFRPPEYRS